MAEQKPIKDDFTLDDFRNQIEQLKKMGPIKGLMGNMPGMSDMLSGGDPEQGLLRIERMIDAMTDVERKAPDLIDLTGQQRIACASGTELHEVTQFLKQFRQVREIVRQMAQMSLWQRIKLVTGFGNRGLLRPPDSHERSYDPF